MVRSCLAVSLCVVLCGGLVRGDDEPEKPEKKLPSIVRPFPVDGPDSDGAISESDMRAAQDKYREDLIEKATQKLLGDQDAQRWIRGFRNDVIAHNEQQGKAVLMPTSSDHGITGLVMDVIVGGDDQPPDGQKYAVAHFSVPERSHGQYVLGAVVFDYVVREERPSSSMEMRTVYPGVAMHADRGQEVFLHLPKAQKPPLRQEVIVVAFIYDSVADQTIVLDASEKILSPSPQANE